MELNNKLIVIWSLLHICSLPLMLQIAQLGPRSMGKTLIASFFGLLANIGILTWIGTPWVSGIWIAMTMVIVCYGVYAVRRGPLRSLRRD
jgi:hypothetical protein